MFLQHLNLVKAMHSTSGLASREVAVSAFFLLKHMLLDGSHSEPAACCEMPEPLGETMWQMSRGGWVKEIAND